MEQEDVATRLGLFSADTLYHYSTATAVLEHILYGGSFRLSPFGMTSDPREYKRWSFAMKGGVSSQDKWLRADFLLNQYLSHHVKVACFCSNRQDCEKWKDPLLLGASKSRMWSQYGDRHQGICVVFSRERLLRCLSQSYASDQILSDSIHYPEGRSVSSAARVFDGEELARLDVETFARKHLIENQREILFSKGLDYRDEDEFRVAVIEPAKESILVPIADCVTAIILGDRFPDWLSQTAHGLASARGVGICRMNWYSGTVMLTDRLEG